MVEVPFDARARGVAAAVVARVVGDGAFAAAALDAELDRAVQLDGRDRALATELVYGTLRLFGWLEERVGRHAKRGIGKLDPVVRAHLAVAAYQIFVLTRVPAFAAVSEAVSAIRAVAGRRSLASPTPSSARSRRSRARTRASSPALRWSRSSRPSAPRSFARSARTGALSLVMGDEGAPWLGLRVETAETREVWLGRFREARPQATFEIGRVSPHALLARGAGRVTALPGYEEGAWTPQEEGSQLVALALGAREGDVVLDACAGRGNKTGLLARAVGASGAVDVADVHPKKLDRLVRELERIHCRPRQAFAVDWALGTGGAPSGYDRVLIDAPCSGSGTLRRRPELMLRRHGSDLQDLARLQRGILERVATLVRPAGASSMPCAASFGRKRRRSSRRRARWASSRRRSTHPRRCPRGEGTTTSASCRHRERTNMGRTAISSPRS